MILFTLYPPLGRTMCFYDFILHMIFISGHMNRNEGVGFPNFVTLTNMLTFPDLLSVFSAFVLLNESEEFIVKTLILSLRGFLSTDLSVLLNSLFFIQNNFLLISQKKTFNISNFQSCLEKA